MPKQPFDLDATPDRLRALADAGVLSPTAMERALHLSVATPPRADWRRFLSTTLLGLGALLVLAGVIYFFAYNWAEMHRFAKMGLIAVAIAGAALSAWKLGETLGGQMSLFTASVLVGGLLAVYGQAYQTGADPYELFVGWTVLILPWVAVSRFPPLGLLALVLTNTGILLFWEQVLGTKEGREYWLAVALGGLNGFTWATYEHFANLRVSWLQARWVPRVLAVMTVTPLLIASVPLVTSPTRATTGAGVALLLVLATLAAEYALHRHLQGELFMLTLGALTVMTLLTSSATSFVFDFGRDAEVFGLFVMPLFVIGQVALAVMWLRHEARVTGASEES
ncbi:putative membrane protein [Myxococcus hansupus]|uniref:Putative membrane protein n=1 Tax=Pseudomyxococcus hansupus TaxID=1297742 RepID=A0A0H4X8Y5_9BACT|nr:DUF2157 domain-containing protein [Myxococcus hansupus]AKQ64327.1 putative membrane protein [Myxococcus hansupus]